MKDSELFYYLKHKKDWKKIENLSHEVNYFISASDKTVSLYFQESDGVKDWKDNLNFLPTALSFSPSKLYKTSKNPLIVHRGFKKEYRSANDQIMEELISKIKEIEATNVIIGGWSNGAAMAVLACEDLFFRTGIKPTLISFGCPKVCFNKKTAKYIKSCCSETREYCNNNDIVTKVPFIGRHLNAIKVGDKFNLKKIFNPWKYHTTYDTVLGSMGL